MLVSIKELLYFVLRILIGFVFILSGFAKFSDPVAFRSLLNVFDFLPSSLLPLLEILIPAIEFVSGICLLVGIGRVLFSFVASCLLLTFLAVLIPILVSGSDVDCGCFGSMFGRTQIGYGLVLRDCMLLGATIMTLVRKRIRYELDNLVFPE